MARSHPFDAITFDGDGRCTPDVDEDVQDELRDRWRAMNALALPTIR